MDEGCTFNGVGLKKDEQYSISFEKLDRAGNDGSEYFMKKQCASYLLSLEDKLVEEIVRAVK